MTTALQAYNFGTAPMRVIERGGEPWFVAADVCAILDIRNPRDAVAGLDDDEKGVGTTDTLGGAQEMNIVSESGLYALIFKSRKAEARRFRKWVTSEVLPAIRRTGGYGEMQSAEQMLAKVELVREARETMGKAAAKRLWDRLELPSPHDRLDSEGAWRDPLIEVLEPWLLATPGPVSLDDVVEGLALEPAGAVTRRRIGRLLRELGRVPTIARRGAHVMRVFVRRSQMVGEA